VTSCSLNSLSSHPGEQSEERNEDGGRKICKCEGRLRTGGVRGLLNVPAGPLAQLGKAIKCAAWKTSRPLPVAVKNREHRASGPIFPAGNPWET
jgi:hypothetical protein